MLTIGESSTCRLVVKMKILCIGDPHIKWNTIPRSREMVESILLIVKERNPDIVVVMGDTLDRFEDVKTTPLDLAVDFLDRLSQMVETFLLIGNHDYPHPSVFMDAPHPFTALRRWQGITVVDKVVNTEIGGYKLTFVPYVATGRFIEALDTAPGWRESRIIFGHQEIKGCKMGAITSMDGDVWDVTNPDLVLGHVHDHQRPQANVLYVGCPAQHSFGDNGLKTISLITLAEGPYHEERIGLGIKKMTLINIEATELLQLVVPETEMLKVVVHGTIAENDAAKKLAIVGILKAAGHKFVFKDRRDVFQARLILDRPQVLRYGDVLYQSMETRPELQDLYRTIFGGQMK